MPTSLGGVDVPIDYTSRDYEGLRADALALAATLTPEWTDFYPTDPGVVIVEAFAYVGDVLSYYIDRSANECFLPTAVQRRSVIYLGRLVGYELRPATSAEVTMEFTVNGAGTIYAGEKVSTDPSATGEDAVVFEVKADTVSLGAGTVDVTCIEGSSVSEVLGSATGVPSPSYVLAQSPLSLDPGGASSLEVYVDEGGGPVLYTEVDDFTGSDSTDRHYIVRVDELDAVTVTFGNGTSGKLLPAGVDNVTANYRVGGGEAGNSVGAGQITQYLGSNPIVDSVTNGTNVPQGGAEKETLDEARDNIPAYARTRDRAVTLADYEDLAELGVAGVRQAKATQGAGPYEIVVYVAATGSDPVAGGTWNPVTESGTGLVGSVGTYLAARKSAPVKLEVRPPDAVPLEMVVALEVDAGFFQSDVQQAVLEAMIGAVDERVMGEDVVLSDLVHAAEEVAGLKNIRVTAFRRQPTVVLVWPDPHELTGLPDPTWVVTPTNYASLAAFHAAWTGASATKPTVEEVWTVKFINGTDYQVVGSVSGVQSTLGAGALVWTNDAGDLTLQMTAGGTPVYVGNEFRITVGSGLVKEDVMVNEYEIATLAEADVTVSSITGGIR